MRSRPFRSKVPVGAQPPSRPLVVKGESEASFREAWRDARELTAWVRSKGDSNQYPVASADGGGTSCLGDRSRSHIGPMAWPRLSLVAAQVR